MSDKKSSSPTPMRQFAPDAIAYWEWRRIAYNLALVSVFGVCTVETWPQLAQMFGVDAILSLLALALLANICYCAAYPVDWFVQASAYRETWRNKRWMLWLLGTLFAATLTYFWSMDEIFGISRIS